MLTLREYNKQGELHIQGRLSVGMRKYDRTHLVAGRHDDVEFGHELGEQRAVRPVRVPPRHVVPGQAAIEQCHADAVA